MRGKGFQNEKEYYLNERAAFEFKYVFHMRI